MFTELLGEAVKKQIDNEILESVSNLKANDISPKLAVIRAGDDSGQIYYANAINKQSDFYGIKTQLISFDSDVTQAMVEVALKAVDEDEDVHGIIMLRPFPNQIDNEALRLLLNSDKDVDAITDISISKTFLGKDDAFHACTAEACMEVLKYYKIPLDGKKVTIVGRSLTVGKPLSILMLNDNATISVCHSKTKVDDQKKLCQEADIVVLATGQTEKYGSDYFRDGQIVLDVGTGMGKDGKMHGDLNISEIKESKTISDLSYTPVPGGIGKVTTALLFRNIVKAASKRI